MGNRWGLGGEGREVPGENEPGPGFKEGEDGEDHPVHEPWRQLCGVRGAQRFVGREDGEEECDYGAVVLTCELEGFEGRTSTTTEA